MTLTFSLRCLGQPLLVSHDAPIRIRTKKHMGLLVYLAVDQRRSHRRDDLAEFFWPKATLAEARHSLSTALSVFRAHLGAQAIDTSREKLAIRAGHITLDLDRLLAGDILGDEFTPALEVAGFLDGFDIPDAPEFGLWKDRQQARLLPAIKQALVSSMDRCRRTGDFQQIEVLAARMLALDDLSEDAIRAQMEARALAGDRIAALRVFEEWKAKLESELQAAPSEMLEGMATRLRGGAWKRVPTPTATTVPTEQWHDRPFVGRNAEYQALYDAWQRSRQGFASHALVLGDSGVGKTTLVQRLMTTVALEGGAVSRVQCYDIEREIPYSAINTLITNLLDQPGISGTPPEALAELARTVPEVRRRFPSIPMASDSHGETARIRLTEAFLDLLLAVTEERAVLLVVDDLHYADDASLAILHLVIRRHIKQPIALTLITRPGDFALSPQAAKLMERVGDGRISEIRINPLDEYHSGIILDQLCSKYEKKLDQRTRRAILKAASGYPMILELLGDDWHANPTNHFAGSVDAITEEPSEGSVIVIYKNILHRITSTLQPASAKTLSLAAILGHRLSDMEMYSLGNLHPEEALNGIAELIHRRILRDNGQQIEFTNELVRGAAYFAVPPTVRKLLHSQVANRFIHQEMTSGVELGIEIAWHCVRGGRSHEAATPLIRGARTAMDRGAPYIAEQALTTALPILGKAEKNIALLLLGEALQEQSRWQESLEHLQQLTTVGEPATAELAHVLVLTAQRRLGHYDGTEQLSHFILQLTDLIHLSQHAPARLRAAIESASALSMVRSNTLAEHVLGAIKKIPNADIKQDELPQLLLARAITNFNLERHEDSLHDIRTAIRILDDCRAINSTRAMLQAGLGAIHSLLGQYDISAEQLSSAAQTALRIGNERIHNLAAANLSVTYNRLGQYEKSIEWANVAMSYTYELHSAAQQGALASYAMIGDKQAVDKLILEWTSALRKHYPPGVWQAWELFCADAYLMLGQRKTAEAYAERAICTEFTDLILDYCGGAYARWVARIGVRDKNFTEASSQIHQLQDNLQRFHSMDQAEILIATAWIEHKQKTKNFDKTRTVATIRLNGLSRGIVEQLHRMGMLDWTEEDPNFAKDLRNAGRGPWKGPQQTKEHASTETTQMWIQE